jgi:large subunit ribosomal protein L10
MITRNKKIETVELISKKLESYKTIVIASIESLSSKQYNSIKKKLRKDAEIVYARKTLLQRALKSKNISLDDHMQGSVVLILTNLNAFKIYNILKSNKSKTKAKPGMQAVSEVMIPAGETNLTPGPVLTELKQAKIDARIQGQKIMILKDCLFLKRGEIVSNEKSAILSKLGIEPFESRIAVIAVYDGVQLYLNKDLDVDEEQLKINLGIARLNALNLAVEIELFSPSTTNLIISKSFSRARALNAKITVEKKIEEVSPTAEPPAESQNN